MRMLSNDNATLRAKLEEVTANYSLSTTLCVARYLPMWWAHGGMTHITGLVMGMQWHPLHTGVAGT